MKNLYSGLPVYKSSQILLELIFTKLEKLPRDYKYTLGEDIKKRAFEILLEIYRANRDKCNKRKHIDIAKDHVEFLKLSFRLLKDLKIIGVKKHSMLLLSLSEVSKQLNGWGKSLSTSL